MAAAVRWASPAVVLLAAAAVLALHPALWLVASWRDPAYNPQGAWVALAVALLALWSWTSEQQPGSDSNRRYAYALLALSALVRLVGQLLRVNVIGALTLAVDVYALGTLAGLHARRRAVSPLWLSVLFALSLPLERVLQRLAGYALQQLAASGACGVLGWFAEGLQCLGTRIVLGGQDLLVDLPCSGARGLMLVLTLYAGLCAVKRPTAVQATLGLVLALTGALAANTLRIVALALGLAYAPGLDLVDGFAHEALGVLALMLAAAPVLVWARAAGRAARASARLRAGSVRLKPDLHRDLHPDLRAKPLAWLLLGFAIVAVTAPARPLDVAREVDPPRPPEQLGGYSAQPRALDAVERAYFARYGGGASKSAYGPFGLLLVSTRAPLRHLHAPDECLRGAGHQVRYLGLAHDGLPSALYRATDADGRSWRVAVSYVSDGGERAASVAEAVWRWLRAPGSVWTQVQRIAPWDVDAAERAHWEAALRRALDLPAPSESIVYRVADAR